MRSRPSRRPARSRITFPRSRKLAVFPRVILIVLDSVGCGELPDAAAYGDEGSDTLGNIARQIPLQLPNLRSLGLDRVAEIGPAAFDSAQARKAGHYVRGAYGR